MKPKILITKELPPEAMKLAYDLFEVTLNDSEHLLTKEELIASLKGCQALLCLLTDIIDCDVITANPQLKVIANYAVGFNNIDIDCATQHHIAVCNTPGVLTESTADLTWALLMATARRIVESDAFVRNGNFKGWLPLLFLGNDVFNKTIGIIGMGRIGQAVARRATGFGMKIIYTSESSVPKALPFQATKMDLHDLLIQADFVTIHTPLTPQTTHLIGENELKMMKPTAILINTARGAIVDEIALIKALRDKTISGAGLDVFEQEPIISKDLIDLPNVVLAPHIGSASIETRTKMGLMSVQNAYNVINNIYPSAIVNPSAWQVSNSV